MEYLNLARVIHVIAVVLWIGGVAMVTMVIIPAIKKLRSKEDRVESFEQIEGRFAFFAKIWVLLTGISGFYMIYTLDAWYRYLDPKFWYFHLMTLVWILFAMVLFVLEPLVLHKLFRERALEQPEQTFRIMHRLHWVLLSLSLIAIIGAVASGHGWFILFK